MKKTKHGNMQAAVFLSEVWRLYNEKHVAKASAAMSYHLTMTFFPLIICLYALFGQNYSTAMTLLGYVSRFLTEDAAEMIGKYLVYISEKSGGAVSVIAAVFLLSSASAAMRAMMSTINGMQGAGRFSKSVNIGLSFTMALGLLVTFYFAFIVLLTGEKFISFISQYVPRITVIHDWPWLRFMLLGGIALAALWIIFRLLRPKNQRYRTLPGAVTSTLAIVLMSQAFASFISASARYRLVYASLASLILMMFWLYLSCQLILLGACVNIALRNISEDKPVTAP